MPILRANRCSSSSLLSDVRWHHTSLTHRLPLRTLAGMLALST
jgi:hypothetical protein